MKRCKVLLTGLLFGLILTGCGGALLGLNSRRRLLHLAAWCVVVTGALSMVRGAAFLRYDPESPNAGCPACQNAAVAPSSAFGALNGSS